jgi:hypothetical protein
MNARLETQPDVKISAAKSPIQAQALRDLSSHDDTSLTLPPHRVNASSQLAEN